MKNSNVRYLCQCSGIAAMYIILTMLATAMGLSSGVIQVRFSEALCILPIFTPAAVPGLTIGCLLANILSGSVMLDVVFGSIATFIGAIETYLLRKKHKFWAFLPPIISNTLIVPWVLKVAYGFADGYWFMIVTVGAGEIVSVGLLGFFLYTALKKHKSIFV